MRKKLKYYDDNDYKGDTYGPFLRSSQVASISKRFILPLIDCKAKDEFLRVGSAYLFFVKNGDWHVHVPRSSPEVEYFTNSFKLIALLAIIESLSEKENVDFFFWLSGQNHKSLFPIADRVQLNKLYSEYKSEYGSIRGCKSFFANLAPSTKHKLCKSVTIDGKPVESIEKLVAMIYQVRSRCAHESDTVLEISNSWCFSKEKNKLKT